MEEATPAYRPSPPDESQLSVGQTVECKVEYKMPPLEGSKYPQGFMVDIGLPEPAFIPSSHVALRPNMTGSRETILGQGFGNLPEGTIIEAEVIGMEDKRVNVSIAYAQRSVAWKRISQLAELDVTIEGRILRLRESGVTIDIEGLPAFMPWLDMS